MEKNMDNEIETGIMKEDLIGFRTVQKGDVRAQAKTLNPETLNPQFRCGMLLAFSCMGHTFASASDLHCAVFPGFFHQILNPNGTLIPKPQTPI